jgi:choline dehydrogenase-like flavoprotein
VLSATFDHDVNPWEGGILTSVVSELENQDGKFHGTKIEALAMHPGLFLPVFPWESGLDYKLFAANLRRTNGLITLTRDSTPGRVYPDPVDGRCRIQYTPGLVDRRHTLEGAIAAAKIAYVSGAREIRTTCRAIPPFVRSDNGDTEDGVNDAAFQAWIKQFRRGNPLDPSVTSFASAHQMGSCRMGATPRRSVVDPMGQVWGTEGLYVADASVFPSASGVNPMVTNMAISDWTSRQLAEKMTREKKTENAARL